MQDIFKRGKDLRQRYYEEHKRSIEDKEEFFAEQARALLSFSKDFSETHVHSGDGQPLSMQWFRDGEINACYNAVDRHAEKTPDKPAIIYESDSGESITLTYAQLLKRITEFSNYLLRSGVKKGDSVCLYMPMETDLLAASLACARIGAAHCVVFGGFSSESLALRMEDSGAVVLITTDTARRGGKPLNYLGNVAEAIEILHSGSKGSPSLQRVLLLDKGGDGKGGDGKGQDGKDEGDKDETASKQTASDGTLTKETTSDETLTKQTLTKETIPNEPATRTTTPNETLNNSTLTNPHPNPVTPTNPTLTTNQHLKRIEELVRVDVQSSIDWSSLQDHVPCVSLPAEHVLFHLYTSGSTGRPKGVSHSTAGYLLYAALTTLVCFDVEANDVFLCTAELGWITGHSYVMYGPLTLGITTVVFGSIPVFPDPFRLFRVVEKYRATHLYTAPTVIRLLQKSLPDHRVCPKDPSESRDDLTPAVDHVPDSPASTRSIFTHGVTPAFERQGYEKKLPIGSPLRNIDLSSLRVLGSVGEPINKGAYIWFALFFGNGNLPVIDTYWQTEAGGVMISPLIGVTTPKPECAGLPFFGMQPLIVKKSTDEIMSEPSGINGLLLFKGCWPGIARTLVNDHQRYEQAYFPRPGYFHTGDEAAQDEQGYFWIRGRIDDVINVSGHRLSTAEIESAVCSVQGVQEAAALGQEDEVTGQSICIFIVKSEGIEEEEVFQKIKQAIRKKIGAVVSPKRIIACSELPKTSTGKMMRRVLRKILEGREVGDVSTCINPEAIDLARESLAR